ncbi:hypothetical protein M441DRAFT_316126 [Trichoderma asperellum CBS 433.97]|uniref:Secreted protein n=1 Tax=Trichoderma asperellum (strain ATCC 204424 / CBS 433.97 / NBRC 101777) TaxID=1042311 RepID=A0A2T3ZKQ1_TRIA4|nr:hypothetical protein M441DRAFT_316126 [Trichoderma asperellum CBS 433.97]PTB45387.1 hypothetical protein M441DRAFT_316126 [Trichoderma asperellum CBS 433.97]
MSQRAGSLSLHLPFTALLSLLTSHSGVKHGHQARRGCPSMRRINMNRASGCSSPSAVAPAVAVRSKPRACCLTPPEGTY